MYDSGDLAAVGGVGPATLSVLRDLIDHGTSRYLEQLRESTPPGLLELLHVPGLSVERIHQFHSSLGVDSLDALEAAARDGRIAALPRLGPKTAARILQGVAFFRRNGPLRLAHHVRLEAAPLIESLRQTAGIARVEAAGSLRRRLELVGDMDLVAASDGDAGALLREIASRPGVSHADVQEENRRAEITFVHGSRLDLRIVPSREFAAAVWRNTGSAEHVNEVESRLAERGLRFDGNTLLDSAGQAVPVADERAMYAAAGLAYIEPELREGRGEVRAAAANVLPSLVNDEDIRGALHCHTVYSDGKQTIADMAEAARARGWEYLGVSDHSRSAFYAGGLSVEQVVAQHHEIDELNARLHGFRVLKGIEADILPDGRLDYEPDVLDRFDFVIGSVHSRFSMEPAAMTQRVLTALDDPHLTVLGHPTGRLLLTREGYGLDLEAVLEKAAEVGAAVELNADPTRMDLDWRMLPRAHELGVPIEIGPDAHSATGLDNVFMGIGMARKGWLSAGDVLNTRGADAILRFARDRRTSTS